jgi:hypothetical protein
VAVDLAGSTVRSPRKGKAVEMKLLYSSRLHVYDENATPWSILMMFALVGVPADIIRHANVGFVLFRGLRCARGRQWLFPILNVYYTM